MVKTGVDATLAFFMCHYVTSKGDDNDSLLFSGGGGHICFGTYFDKNYFRNYMEGKIINAEGNMSDGFGYNRISNVWGEYRDTISPDKLAKSISPRQNGEVKNLDIFHFSKKGEKAFVTDYEVEWMAKDFVSYVEAKG